MFAPGKLVSNANDLWIVARTENENGGHAPVSVPALFSLYALFADCQGRRPTPFTAFFAERHRRHLTCLGRALEFGNEQALFRNFFGSLHGRNPQSCTKAERAWFSFSIYHRGRRFVTLVASSRGGEGIKEAI